MATTNLVFKNQEQFDILKESPSYINDLYEETKNKKFTELEFCGFLIHGKCSDEFKHYEDLSPFIIGELYYRQPSLKDKLDLSKIESDYILPLILKDEKNIDLLNLKNLSAKDLKQLMLHHKIKIERYKNKVDFSILGIPEYTTLLTYKPNLINIYKQSSNFDMGTYKYYLKTFPKCIIFEKG